MVESGQPYFPADSPPGNSARYTPGIISLQAVTSLKFRGVTPHILFTSSCLDVEWGSGMSWPFTSNKADYNWIGQLFANCVSRKTLVSCGLSRGSLRTFLLQRYFHHSFSHTTVSFIWMQLVLYSDLCCTSQSETSLWRYLYRELEGNKEGEIFFTALPDIT